jgi:hypothetical protein
VRRIGVLINFAPDDPAAQSRLTTFLQGLQQLGWTDGRNVRIDTRWGGGCADRFVSVTDPVGNGPLVGAWAGGAAPCETGRWINLDLRRDLEGVLMPLRLKPRIHSCIDDKKTWSAFGNPGLSRRQVR